MNRIKKLQIFTLALLVNNMNNIEAVKNDLSENYMPSLINFNNNTSDLNEMEMPALIECNDDLDNNTNNGSELQMPTLEHLNGEDSPILIPVSEQYLDLSFLNQPGPEWNLGSTENVFDSDSSSDVSMPATVFSFIGDEEVGYQNSLGSENDIMDILSVQSNVSVKSDNLCTPENSSIEPCISKEFQKTSTPKVKSDNLCTPENSFMNQNISTPENFFLDSNHLETSEKFSNIKTIKLDEEKSVNQLINSIISPLKPSKLTNKIMQEMKKQQKRLKEIEELKKNKVNLMPEEQFVPKRRYSIISLDGEIEKAVQNAKKEANRRNRTNSFAEQKKFIDQNSLNAIYT